jgi:hypothetical protein
MPIMRVREAKDFLVQQTTQQASIENVSFSDLEKRMMYFTESGGMTEDALDLNNAFEEEYDTAEYETKVGKLMAHAYSRIKKENPQSVRAWNEAVLELRKGDHYILLLLRDSSNDAATNQKLFSRSFWKMLGLSVFLIVVALAVIAVMMHNAESGPPH